MSEHQRYDETLENEIRSRQGAFFTPKIWADESHKLIEQTLGGTSKPVEEENFRRVMAFFNARLFIDPRRKANWHLSQNVHTAPNINKDQ